MPTLSPVASALVPVDSAAAEAISAPNYDEFQSDLEVWEILQRQPKSLLTVTMSHCHVGDLKDAPSEGGEVALQHAAAEMQKLIDDEQTRTIEGLLWVYEITSPKRPNAPQLGVGGHGATAEIRTDENPAGNIIRNEGIRPEKMQGRADLLNAISADTGFVNLAVQDKSGQLLDALNQVAASRACDLEVIDEDKNRHRVWFLTDAAQQQKFVDLIQAEPAAYVADGNHRSAAAAQLGKPHFLSVFFPTGRLGLEPYNRLLPLNGLSAEEFLGKVQEQFELESLGAVDTYRPDAVNKFGLYIGGSWHSLTPKAGSFNPDDAAEAIDAAIIQQHIIDGLLGMSDARDKRINYVGGNKDAAYLKARVDAGDYDLALSLAPVTMDQFVAVCEQNKFMPPKSTWFDPKIRTGLVISLL
ncbi:MAG: DUF1015 domain-containing protein [Planctomycetaceae bacterium]|nr:DUF1015 domain-containing protein [Planctomycetaceae bacterium]MCB9953145.1 DUF1015 domain-containing protein [Planctomycetaceae bacterium]